MIEIVESAKLPQLAHHLRPIFGLVISVTEKAQFISYFLTTTVDSC